MEKRKKIIVYGTGSRYKNIRVYLENKFEIVGYSDSYNTGGGIIDTKDIYKYDYDYVCITSTKYFDEIKENLIHLLGNDKTDRIISIYDVIGDFRNGEVRDNWVIEHLKKISAGNTLLDAGAGEQKYKSYCTHLKYIAQDFGKYVPNEIVAGIQNDKWDYSGVNITCDIIDMPLESASIDVVLCTEVFEHLKNPILALKEFSRVLKSGGILLLTAPFCCLTHMAPYFYYNGFSEYWYREHLANYNFKIIEFTRNGNYFKYMSQELFRVADMAERYCNYEMSDEERSTLFRGIEIMMNLSEKDINSNETLCFGNMLVAEKVG